MKNFLKNKKVLFALLLALVLGGLIGWLIKASNNQTKASTEHQHTETTDEVWTCSMHPQIRLSEPGSCPICGMDLIPATSQRSTLDENPLVHEMTPQAIAMANIHTSRVTGVSPEGELFLTGKVKADERQLASVTAKFPGRIEQLFVNFTGQVVRQGERLATIYSPELVTTQKELLEAASTKATYPELYDAAREKLRLWKLNEKQIDALENSRKVQDQFDVLADKAGIVTQRNIAVGDYVSTGSVLFDVVDLSRVWIMIDAYESDLPFVKMGDEVSFTAAGIPGQTFTAKVTYIDPVINANTRAASVRAEASNGSGELRPEMFINARIRTTLRKGQSSLAIPRTALLWSGKRSIVYVKVPETEFPAFEMREITIGPRMGEMWLVEVGLEAGEEIVTNGVFAIDAAAQLSGNYSMLMRPETKTMDVPQAFRQQITAVADAYFKVKNALVEDSSEEATSALNEVENAITQVEMRNLKGKAHDHWMALKEQLTGAIQMMKEAKDLETLRQHFSMLSQNMLEITESFGLEKEKVYKDFCPMAFDNKGAFWLSESEEILNPYFGETMVSCGEVKKTYLKGQKVFEEGGPAKQQSAGGHNH
ncbi:efflux RND transporter periplasmic adaptor subunit [Antarcticibacterium flavum]|uniref:Efflux RND transporter periplasmic adaptor subunit n=1 Tax=Antarcticibacterium flavum TaxID=2058175 RepID=A0A5B7X6H7_9FLAO|nr:MULTISPECIES: efflux RND transporter periplasmic adaptor subunit [Antarcticibacterium]MCM4158467.1 efflux RND transporter periplasmic adaptor subunit [Antarcticibacterium sp. W02-3]QCY70223.1 efflux RND transporter periplasmic adaptor subunit [Antarcticibacterium flavum]